MRGVLHPQLSQDSVDLLSCLGQLVVNRPVGMSGFDLVVQLDQLLGSLEVFVRGFFRMSLGSIALFRGDRRHYSFIDSDECQGILVILFIIS